MTTLNAPVRAGPPAVPLGSAVPRFLAVCAQLALILVAVYQYRIEPDRPFFLVLCLASGGFLVHAWLPRRVRAAFFTLLSAASIVLLFGWTDGGWVLGLGGALLAVCYLPIPLAFRVLLVAFAGVGLALWRVDSDAPFWPILGSMFMFRLIVYLFELRRDRRPPLAHSLAYFFALPNLCFTFFPVLDFKTFRETYYDDEPHAIYQSGVNWIARGLMHLLAYRVVKYYLLPAPHEMRDLPHILLFLATNYALYLRFSGWFHVATGILHLFGFNVPRTHYNYFLASSVRDIWQRINIYWKDFMTKIFFFPTFFALRGWGTRAALACAGLTVFVATWLLHSYQMFWLRNELPLSLHLALRDGILWLTAGVLVTANLLLDQQSAKRTEASASPKSAGAAREALAAAVHSLKIVGTFLLVSLFWACWTLPRFPSYLYVLAKSGAINAMGVLTLAAIVAGAVAVGVLVRFGRDGLARLRWQSPGAALPVSTALLALVIAGSPRVGELLNPAFPRAAEVLATLKLESTTPVESVVAVQGYYDQLADVPMPSSPLLAWGRPTVKPAGASYADVTQPADDFLGREPIPGWSGVVAGKSFSINRFGMRDRADLTRAKPLGVCRIAFVGSSVVMGWGVGDDETCTRLLEAKLNAAKTDDSKRVEVLNFGRGDSYAIQHRVLIDRVVFQFDPDAVYYVAHQDEFLGWVRHLARIVARGNALPYPCLREVVRQSGVTPQTPQGEMEARFQPLAPELLRGVYGEIVAECRQRGVLPVWIYVPAPGIVSDEGELVEIAKQAGFVVVSLAHWDNKDAGKNLMADPYHANAEGHRVLAERLLAVLRQRPDALPPGLRLK